MSSEKLERLVVQTYLSPLQFQRKGFVFLFVEVPLLSGPLVPQRVNTTRNETYVCERTSLRFYRTLRESRGHRTSPPLNLERRT